MLQQDCSNGGDELLISAIMNPPLAAPLVPAEVLAACQQTLAERASPEAARTLRTLRESRKMVMGHIAAAQETMGIAKEDPLRVTARTGIMN